MSFFWEKNHKIKLAGAQAEYDEIRRQTQWTASITDFQERELQRLAKKISMLKVKIGENLND